MFRYNSAMTKQILKVNSSDLPGLRDLATAIWLEHYPGIISHAQIKYMLERDYAVSALEREMTNGVIMNKLVVDDAVAGFSAYGPLETGQTIKLHKLYLRQSFHGKGLGSTLLKHIEQKSL